jgi:hypothetical protein
LTSGNRLLEQIEEYGKTKRARTFASSQGATRSRPEVKPKTETAPDADRRNDQAKSARDAPE